jgi:hypothetical protein
MIQVIEMKISFRFFKVCVCVIETSNTLLLICIIDKIVDFILNMSYANPKQIFNPCDLQLYLECCNTFSNMKLRLASYILKENDPIDFRLGSLMH